TIGWDLPGPDITGEVIPYCIRQYEISIGKSLHKSRSSKAVCSMVTKVGLPGGKTSRNSSFKIVIYPDTTHGIMHRGINHHRSFIRVLIYDLLIHLEKVTVFCFYHSFP